MVKRSFTVRALWDGDAKVYYSESDIIGLHIETATLDEFEAVLFEVGPDLIVANHMSKPELASQPLEDLIPAIVWSDRWKRPDWSRAITRAWSEN